MMRPLRFLCPFFLLAANLAQSQTALTKGQWLTQSVQPSNTQGRLQIDLVPQRGNFDLYARKGAAPTLTTYDVKFGSTQVSRGNTNPRIILTNRTTPQLTSDRWYFGAYAKTNGNCSLKYRLTSTTSEFSGKGAVPFNGGTTFRVWAPNASAAWVSGQFNSWSTTAGPMVSEGNGWYSLDLRGATAGQQYKFILKNGSSTFWKIDPYSRQVTNSVGNSVIYDHNAYTRTTQNFVTPNWNQVVMMEIHIGSFNDTAGGSPGTFTTAIAKLDYLKDLGVNCVEIMPVNEFPGDFSWGYNPSDIFAVESAYGGPTGLKQFVDQANARGIAVIMDTIHNHWGTGDLDMWVFDGWSISPWGGIYFYNDNRAVTPWGNTRPDYGRSEVRQFILDNESEFLSQYQLSGLRYDSTSNMKYTNSGYNADGYSLLQAINNQKNSSQPWKINIAEDLQNDAAVTRSTSLGGEGFDAQWSNYVHTMRSAIITSDDTARDMNSVAGAITENFNGNAFARVICTENHDEDANGNQRVTSSIDSSNPGSYWSQKRSTLGAAITLTSPGIPMLFQGQDILESGYFSDSIPVDWTKATTYAGIRQMYKDLISLRRNLGGQTAGLTGSNVRVFHTNNTNKVIAYQRWLNGGSGDDVVVVANFKNTTWNNYRVGFPWPGTWKVVFNSDASIYSSLFGNLACPDVSAGSPAQDGYSYSGTVNLAPYSVVILSRA